MIAIERYIPSLKNQWDDFVASSKNGTFILMRDYMDYHKDRFTDNSLIFTDNGKILGVLPASLHIDGNRKTLISHGGLTYGGLIMPVKGFNAMTALEIFDSLKRYALNEGIGELIYKAIPHIYHRQPAEEDIYALFRNGAKFAAVNISSTIDLKDPIPFDCNIRRNLKLASRAGVTAALIDDFRQYWDMLSDRLEERYSASPVHNLDEMTALKERFPDNIKLMAAMHHGEMVAGIVAYLTHTCIHTQYIATSERGRELRALPVVVRSLMEEFGDGRAYFDFGTCNEDGGRYLNEGLIDQKNRYGGRAIAYMQYSLCF